MHKVPDSASHISIYVELGQERLLLVCWRTTFGHRQYTTILGCLSEHILHGQNVAPANSFQLIFPLKTSRIGVKNSE